MNLNKVTFPIVNPILTYSSSPFNLWHAIKMFLTFYPSLFFQTFLCARIVSLLCMGWARVRWWMSSATLWLTRPLSTSSGHSTTLQISYGCQQLGEKKTQAEICIQSTHFHFNLPTKLSENIGQKKPETSFMLCWGTKAYLKKTFLG